MRVRVITVCLVAIVGLAGCMSDQAAKELREAIETPLNSINSMARDLSRSRDLTYAVMAFQRKKGRWPKEYRELSKFVEDTDGLLQLAKYDRVDFIERPQNSLEIRSVIEAQTNSMMFTQRDAAK